MNRKDTNGIRKCYVCGRTNHIACDCRSTKIESSGSWHRPKKPSNAKVVQSGTARMQDLNLLFKLCIQTVMKVRMVMFKWSILGMEEVTLCVLKWRSKECQPMVL